MSKEDSDQYYRFVGLVTISSCYISSLLSVSSKHFGNILNIQPNNVNVYLNKLNTLRSVLTLVGTILGGLILTHVYEHVRYLCIGSLGLLTLVRLMLIIILYVSKRLALHIYIILVIEGFVSGMTQLSIVVSFPQYASTIVLSTYTTVGFVEITQTVLEWFTHHEFLVFRIQCVICILCSIGSVGLWSYLFNNKSSSD